MVTSKRNPLGGLLKMRRSTRRSSSHPAFGASLVIQSKSILLLRPPIPISHMSSQTRLCFGSISLIQYSSYLGEVLLQLGPPLLALPSLPPTQLRTLVFISPIFTYFLLRYASGVPPLEQSAEKKWGKEKEWREYADKTSVLVPWPLGLGKGKAAEGGFA